MTECPDPRGDTIGAQDTAVQKSSSPQLPLLLQQELNLKGSESLLVKGLQAGDKTPFRAQTTLISWRKSV